MSVPEKSTGLALFLFGFEPLQRTLSEEKRLLIVRF